LSALRQCPRADDAAVFQHVDPVGQSQAVLAAAQGVGSLVPPLGLVVSMTFAPSSRNSRALARPTLPAPPVSTQTLLSSSPMPGQAPRRSTRPGSAPV
jgi:hypothetical protein